MPQASEVMRAAWGGYEGVGDDKACHHLKMRGFKLTPQWEWQKPSPDYVLDADDVGAISFLIQEWDYGGLAPDIVVDGDAA
jgi:hypothetical protein